MDGWKQTTLYPFIDSLSREALSRDPIASGQAEIPQRGRYKLLIHSKPTGDRLGHSLRRLETPRQ